VRRVWVAAGLLAVGLSLGLVQRETGGRGLLVVSGLFDLAAIVLVVSLLPFWDRLGWRLPPAGRLFTRPRRGEKWSARDGRPVTVHTATKRPASGVDAGASGSPVERPEARIPPGAPPAPRPRRRK
jgi:hypothetical protein